MADSSNAGNNPPNARGSTEDTPPDGRRRGLSPRGERVGVAGGTVVMVALAIPWTWSMALATQGEQRPPPPPTRKITEALTNPSVPTAAYVTNATLDALAKGARGASGKLRAQTALPGEVDEALKNLTDFTQITLTPLAAKQRGRVGLYYIG